MNNGRDVGTSCGCQITGSYMLYRALFAFFFVFAAAFTVFPSQATAQNYTFNSVEVEGNQRIETSTIVTRAGIARGQTVSAGQLNDAYKRILDSGVFETVEIIPRGSTLVIKVVEYPTINKINFEGNRRIKDENLADAVTSESRRVFTPEQAERDAQLIAEIYSSQGRVAATVVPRIIRRDGNRVDLVFEISEGDTIEIERVSFVGNRAYSDRRLRRVLETKQAGFLRAFIRSDTFIADRIEFDKQVLRDFYLSRGYVDFRVNSANVEFTRERDAFFLVMDLQEGQQFAFGNITTVSEIPGVDAAEYQDALKVKPGVIYSPSLVENSIARQERLGLRNGVDFLRVEPRITRNNRDLTLDVEFALVKGPRIFVERIDIEGNTTTLDRVIRQQFRSVEGDPFNPREIRESAERIRALGFFAESNVETREGTSPDRVFVDVDVEEQPTGSLSLGGSYSVNDGFGVAIGLNERNFLGRGQTLGVTLSTAQDAEQYVLGFSEPNLLGRDLRFDLDLGISERNSSFANYDTSRKFFNPGLTFRTGELSTLQLRYRWEASEMIARANTTTGAVITSEIAQGERSSSILGASYVYDSRLGGLNPNAGVRFEVGLDAAGLGGDNEYFKTTAKTIAQTRVWHEEITLRATLEAGAFSWRGNGSSRTIDRFIFGPDVFRGFEPAGIGPRDLSGGQDDALGGNYYAVARLEAEFPLGLPEELGIRGGVFYDVGNVWDLSNVNTAGGTIVGADGSFRHVIGFSVLWTTAFGPLRFNFTKALKKETFDKEQSFDLTIQARF
ncbi:outer membrane protein assembly factor BamA [Tropicibacter sp. R16_0]|uniref:outer membrane protein assembly factor BamA n=1 Tax=Tropicibacter sp. R16_0 TaxID=2821102 RepID=UPI001ADD4D2E|nr:outer membrane protein assembly factor BamA [Tropicibacter sp. R16_0]MBO9449440.1 outer membrane protein assembly factor BamA [Tropicibacter sp. R16_0]